MIKVWAKTVAFALTVLATSQVDAAITEKKDSREFSHRYEMDLSPDLVDIDGNGTNDFTLSTITSGNLFKCSTGVLTIYSFAASGTIGFYNNTDGGSWRTLAPTRSSGFTVELRMRVNTHSDPVNGAIGVAATASDSNADSQLCIGTNFVKWGYNTAGITLSEADNSDDFHTFRIAMEGGQQAGSETFTVWRDGALLADYLTDYAPNNGLNRFNFGDISTAYIRGNVDIDYARFTSGAYAPAYTTGYAQRDSSKFDKKFEMKVAEDEVAPAGDTLEWKRGVAGTYTAALSEGNLHVSTGNAIGAKAFWESATWTNVIAPGDSFTVEIRMRVDASLGAAGDRAFAVSAGNGDALVYFTVGTNHVYYAGNSIVFLDNNDNSDRMHTFRLAYDAEGPSGFQIWRDGVQIGTNLVSTHQVSRLYFGDSSSGFSGRGAFDYVRWTKGIFAPLPPSARSGLIVTLGTGAIDLKALHNLRDERAQLAAKPRRLIANNDGCDALYFPNNITPTEQSFLGRRTVLLAGKQAGTISYCTISSGFSFFTHDTKVGEVLTRQGADYGIRPDTINITADLISQGTDTLKAVTDFAHTNGMECFWSMRMNDTHDVAHRPATPYLLFPTLKEEHPEWLVGNCVKRTPFGRWSSVDYGHAEIRELAFRYIEEVCLNYDVDGIDLDFFRHLCYFSSVANGGKATPTEVKHMNDLIRRIRVMTEEVGLKRKRPILILMRLPDSLEFCRDIGLDLKTWLEEGLLDILVTTGYFKLNSWEYSVTLGHKYDVKVYPSLDESRVSGEIRFKRNSVLGYRGRAAQAWAAQADGLYLFNLYDVSANSPLWDELGDPGKLAFTEKVYFATDRDYSPSAWLANGVKYRNIPFITPSNPVTLKTEKDFVTHINFTEDLSAADTAGLEPTIKLHLYLPQLEDAQRITLVLNGHLLPDGTLNGEWLDWQLTPAQLQSGKNGISIGLHSAPASQILKDIVISVAYQPKP